MSRDESVSQNDESIARNDESISRKDKTGSPGRMVSERHDYSTNSTVRRIYLVNIGLGRRTAQKRVTGGRWRRIVLGGVLAGQANVPRALVLGFHGPNTIHTIDGYKPPRTERTEPQHPASKQPSPAARFFLYRICRACALTQCHALDPSNNMRERVRIDRAQPDTRERPHPEQPHSDL